MSTIEEITSKDEIEKCRKLFSEMLEDEYSLSLEWLRKNNWIVVPTPEGLSVEFAESITKAVTALPAQEILALNTDGGMIIEGESADKTTHELYRISARQGEIIKWTGLDFNWSRDFLLSTPAKHFAILLTSKEYNLIAGPEEFVKSVFNGDIKKARIEFREFATQGYFKENFPELEKYFLEIDKRYNQNKL